MVIAIKRNIAHLLMCAFVNLQIIANNLPMSRHATHAAGFNPWTDGRTYCLPVLWSMLQEQTIHVPSTSKSFSHHMMEHAFNCLRSGLPHC